MERKDEAAVERQKLVDDGEVENEDDQTTITANVPPTSAPKSVQTPNSPVLSNRVRITHSCLKGFPLSWRQENAKESKLLGTTDKQGVSLLLYFRYFQVAKPVERKILAIVLL